jgi:hypothetical protein
MTPRACDAQEAKRQLRTYQSNHRIVPATDPMEPTISPICGYCKVAIYTIKGGWRHKIPEVRVLVEKAPIPHPGEYR